MNAQVSPELLPVTSTAIAEYSATEAGLAELRAQLDGATFDCSTVAGDKLARDSRLALVRLRSALESKRKELKDPLLERGRLLDAEAKRITGEILKLEQPIDAAIKAEEARREAVRAERERRERERVGLIQARIDGIRHLPLELVGAPASVVEEAIDKLTESPIDREAFAEFADDAERVHGEALEKLRDVLAAQREAERLQAELRAQREEQERQRLADEERLAAERAELAKLREQEEARQAEARQRQAEEDRAAAAARAEADRVAREKREAEAAAARAEQERVAAEQEAERQRLAAEAARIEAEKAEARAREEQAAVDAATALDAMQEAHAWFTANKLGDLLVARKLAAVLAKDAQA